MFQIIRLLCTVGRRREDAAGRRGELVKVVAGEGPCVDGRTGRRITDVGESGGKVLTAQANFREQS